jgi:cation diffusion facilitator CzcD-associated flavoprotein CzcO
MMARFEDDPDYYYEYRRNLEKVLAGGFGALWRGSEAQAYLKRITLDHMEKMITKPKILKALTPEFEIGCRRFTPGDHYLDALNQDNVEMITDGIVRVTETGIIDTSGLTRDIDVIVCATGFDASYEPRFPVIGQGGYSLKDNWGVDKTTESYMGAMVARFPNFFGTQVSFPMLTLHSALRSVLMMEQRFTPRFVP